MKISSFRSIDLCRSAVRGRVTIRLRLDGRSTGYQRSLRSQWRNPLAAVMRTDIFIMPRTLGGALSDDAVWRLTSVYLSVWRLSVCRVRRA